eukprot:3347602-Pyramimonas_sp.AAC.1
MPFEASWDCLDTSWGPLGAPLGTLEALLRLSRRTSIKEGRFLLPAPRASKITSWGPLGARWNAVGRSWGAPS